MSKCKKIILGDMMTTIYLVIGTLISLLLIYVIKAFENDNYKIKKLFFKKSQMIKFKKEKGE
ncbi:MAG: hypothetical protein K0Q49_1074 [Haloplasmataceae bacterium]|jgi:hypothetical protein|nr:hypothetical protein [Haloplasmataceae bacterium]